MVEKIRAICKQRGITVRELEQRAGLFNAIYRWDENRPSVDRVKAVADVLGVTVDDLLREDSNGTNHNG